MVNRLRSDQVVGRPGQEVLIVTEGGVEKMYLVLAIDQLEKVRATTPKRLRQIEGQWCVRVFQE